MKDDILVSICCVTYNQEKFIGQAIESFLNQDTNFKYEIIINDDASTDNTVKIIKEYKKKYTDIIKPRYQKENQYSKGKKVLPFTFEKAQGKYIAICEGDDYWIDNNKLQKQVDYMEAHPECTLCFHDAKILNMKTGKMKNFFPQNPRYKKFFHKNNIYNGPEVGMLGSIPTASMMFKKSDVERIPDWFHECVVEDKPLDLIMTSFGYAYCLNECMSVYRVNIGNSTMDYLKKENEDIYNALEFYNKMEFILDKFDEFTSYKYDVEMNIMKQYIMADKMYIKKQYKNIIKEGKMKFFSGKMKLIIFLRAYLPFIYDNYKKLKKK